jgi:hypothetical protein
MMTMVIFSVMSAGLLYASRVPAVQEEWSLLFTGKVNSAASDDGRTPHLVFILFTFTSPLLLAGALSTGMAALRWWERR